MSSPHLHTGAIQRPKPSCDPQLGFWRAKKWSFRANSQTGVGISPTNATFSALKAQVSRKSRGSPHQSEDWFAMTDSILTVSKAKLQTAAWLLSLYELYSRMGLELFPYHSANWDMINSDMRSCKDPNKDQNDTCDPCPDNSLVNSFQTLWNNRMHNEQQTANCKCYASENPKIEYICQNITQYDDNDRYYHLRNKR